jgi:hypothetical protein
MPTAAAASTNTMTAKTVNNPTTATTHGVRVLTPRFYARLPSLAVTLVRADPGRVKAATRTTRLDTRRLEAPMQTLDDALRDISDLIDRTRTLRRNHAEQDPDGGRCGAALEFSRGLTNRAAQRQLVRFSVPGLVRFSRSR